MERAADFEDRVSTLRHFINWDALIQEAKAQYDSGVTREPGEGEVEDECEAMISQLDWAIQSPDDAISFVIEEELAKRNLMETPLSRASITHENE